MLYDSLLTYLTPLGKGALWTIALFLSSAVLAVILGLITCFARMSKIKIVRNIAKLYIEVIRGTPLLVQLFFIYYGLPEIGIVMSGFVAGTIGLTMNFGAYLAELFRGGIQSVSGGQHEASRALNLTTYQRLYYVIIPQAARTIFPALSNYALVLIKETSLVAIISVTELLRSGEMLAAATFEPLFVYSLVAIIYMIMCGLISLMFQRGERRLSIPGYWDGASDSIDLTKT